MLRSTLLKQIGIRVAWIKTIQSFVGFSRNSTFVAVEGESVEVVDHFTCLGSMKHLLQV